MQINELLKWSIINMVNKYQESAFDWIVLPAELDKKYLVKVVFKTPTMTDHTRDVRLPLKDRKIRYYSPEELLESTRTLIQKPLDINHEKDADGHFIRIPNAFVWDAQYNDGNSECLCYIPHDNIIKAFKEGLITEVSPESLSLRGEEVKGNIVEPQGLVFTGLALIVPELGEGAGDPNTRIELFETVGFGNAELLETVIYNESQKIQLINVDPNQVKFSEEFKVDKLDRLHKRAGKFKDMYDRKETIPPIAVYKEGDSYSVHDGHARVLAFRELGVKECPAILLEKGDNPSAGSSSSSDDSSKSSDSSSSSSKSSSSSSKSSDPSSSAGTSSVGVSHVECGPSCSKELVKIDKLLETKTKAYEESVAIKAKEEELAKLDAKFKELELCVTKLQETINKQPDILNTAVNEAKEQGRKEGIKLVVGTVEKVLPPKDVLTPDRGLTRLNQDVRRVLYPFEDGR